MTLGDSRAIGEVGMMALSCLPLGVKARLAAMPLQDALYRRMAAMGLPVGSEVRVVSRGHSLILVNDELRIALDRELAARVLVEVQEVA